MERICIGRTRKQENHAQSEHSARSGDWLMTFGIAVLTIWLAFTAVPEKTENVKYLPDDAAMVMSTAVSTSGKEELVLPDRETAGAGETSIFDMIGEFFASLIFGE